MGAAPPLTRQLLMSVDAVLSLVCLVAAVVMAVKGKNTPALILAVAASGLLALNRFRFSRALRKARDTQQPAME